jgi:hypothetical protein
MLAARLGGPPLSIVVLLGERTTLKKTEEYRRYAAECRGIARMVSPTIVYSLEQLARKREGRKKAEGKLGL